MIDLSLNRVRPGMVMAQSVYNSSGANYLTKGMPLTQTYIEKLRQLGIEDIHVLSTSIDDMSPLPQEDVLQEKTRVMAVKRVYDVFQQIRQKGTLDLAPLEKASATIVNDVMNRRGNLVQLTDIRMHDMYTFAHSVNVAMLSSLIGVLCGFSEERLSELTFGALLHDLGKIVVPLEVLNKTSRLSKTEFSIIKKHPIAGSDHILKLNLPNGERLAMIARQHHEHMDGSGYPDGRKGEEIHIHARIAAIADVYDALTSNRPYKKAYTPAVAHHIMKNCSGGQFDEEILNEFFRNVAIYPVGTVLSTSLGYGIVRKVEFGKTSQPNVCIFADKNEHLLKKPYDVDFSEEKGDRIESVINDIELFHFIHQLQFDPAMLLLEDGLASLLG